MISIHSLRTEGDDWKIKRTELNINISIHSLRTEGDQLIEYEYLDEILFQSTPSGRRETTCVVIEVTILRFQSTPSGRRETYGFSIYFSGIDIFQSTPSGRRETVIIFVIVLTLAISIHSLRTEGDLRNPLRTPSL